MHSSVTAHANPTDIKEKNGQKNGTDIFLHRYRTGFMLPKLFCFSMSCCFSLSGSHLIARSRRSPFSFSFPYASSFSRLSKLNCTLDSPFTFHFLSACNAFFSQKLTCFHRNSTWWSFILSLDSTLYYYYDLYLFLYLVQVLFNLLTAYAS